MAAIDEPEVIDLLSALVRIPRVNPGMGGGAGEGKLAGFLTERLRALEVELRRAR